MTQTLDEMIEGFRTRLVESRTIDIPIQSMLLEATDLINALLAEREGYLTSNNDLVECHSCINGYWETECCSGAGGCSCRGQRIPMGVCLVCNGSGFHKEDADALANAKSLGGSCYIGSGPTDGRY
jgi:hypothetical protein